MSHFREKKFQQTFPHQWSVYSLLKSFLLWGNFKGRFNLIFVSVFSRICLHNFPTCILDFRPSSRKHYNSMDHQSFVSYASAFWGFPCRVGKLSVWSVRTLSFTYSWCDDVLGLFFLFSNVLIPQYSLCCPGFWPTLCL